ncbi:hypothetical protein VTG60DRAFT_806 [Thermothelomyces hinnuleus]
MHGTRSGCLPNQKLLLDGLAVEEPKLTITGREALKKRILPFPAWVHSIDREARSSSWFSRVLSGAIRRVTLVVAVTAQGTWRPGPSAADPCRGALGACGAGSSFPAGSSYGTALGCDMCPARHKSELHHSLCARHGKEKYPPTRGAAADVQYSMLSYMVSKCSRRTGGIVARTVTVGPYTGGFAVCMHSRLVAAAATNTLGSLSGATSVMAFPLGAVSVDERSRRWAKQETEEQPKKTSKS